MTWPIPRQTGALAQPREVTAIKRGDEGWSVWALQRALEDLRGYSLVIDGDYGAATEQVVKALQTARQLTPDGIAGPATQHAIAVAHVTLCDEGLPKGLLDGFAEREGGWLLAAVNSSTPGGIDCGLFQRRVYVADYANDPVVRRAFNTKYQAGLLVASLQDRRAAYLERAGTRDGTIALEEKAWRLAALNHNYPSGADQLSRTPVRSLSSYWTSTQDWVIAARYRFPNGDAVRTPLDWCHFYSGVLGAGVHGTSGSVTKNVTRWS